MTQLKKAEFIQYTTKEWADMGYKKANKILESMPLLQRLQVLQNAPESRTPYGYWIRKSKAELMQWYMNAFVTSSCLGHLKAERNEGLIKYYSEIMKQYSIPEPANEICYILGVFNGEGAC